MLNVATWIGISANLAAVIGLAFVALQLRQNTAAMRNAAYQTWVAANMDLNMAVTTGELGRILATGHRDPKALSRDTFVQYAMFVFSLMQMIQATDHLYQTGAIHRSLWDVEMQRAAGHLTLPGARQWWDAGGKRQLEPEFVRRVEATPAPDAG